MTTVAGAAGRGTVQATSCNLLPPQHAAAAIHFTICLPLLLFFLMQVSIVQEKYRKSGSMSPNELASLYSDLYTHLMDHMHAALHDVTEATPKPQPPAVPNTQVGFERVCAQLRVGASDVRLRFNPPCHSNVRHTAAVLVRHWMRLNTH